MTSLPTQLVGALHTNVVPEKRVGRTVERGDEPLEDGTEYLGPHGGLLSQDIEAAETAVALLPVGPLAFEGDGRDAAFMPMTN